MSNYITGSFIIIIIITSKMGASGLPYNTLTLPNASVQNLA